MRDFGATPEPSGAEEIPSSPAPRFVVQEHHATALHWDFRLEREGVLPSWAVPMGIPPDPRENHLAVQTEDHPLSYIDFGGEIPAGGYGAGTVTVWDSGTYDLEKWTDDEVVVRLHGSRVRGRYVLFRTRGRDWMIHRMDPAEDPTRDLLGDRRFEPMHPVPGDVVARPGEWVYEPAWPGVRCMLTSKGGRVRADGEHGEDVTPAFPELRVFGRSLGAVEVVLDGVLVVSKEGEAPTETAARSRLVVKSESSAARRAARSPATFVATDLVWLEGHPTAELALRDRRRLLERLEIRGPSWRTTPQSDDREVMRQATAAQSLPGMVAKRSGSPYRHGETSDDWVLIPG